MPQSRLSLEKFLLELLQTISIQSMQNIIQQPSCPAWLMEALNEFVSHQLWNMNSQDFAKLAGRSPEHVARTVHKFMRKTTSELLNGYRVEKAAADLCMTNKAVIEISMDVGFENLGYFYRVFKKHFGECECSVKYTPLGWNSKTGRLSVNFNRIEIGQLD